MDDEFNAMADAAAARLIAPLERVEKEGRPDALMAYFYEHCRDGCEDIETLFNSTEDAHRRLLERILKVDNVFKKLPVAGYREEKLGKLFSGQSDDVKEDMLAAEGTLDKLFGLEYDKEELAEIFDKMSSQKKANSLAVSGNLLLMDIIGGNERMMQWLGGIETKEQRQKVSFGNSGYLRYIGIGDVDEWVNAAPGNSKFSDDMKQQRL